MRVGGGLGHEDAGTAFDEVVRAYVGHDLGAGENLGVELGLQLMELLVLIS